MRARRGSSLNMEYGLMAGECLLMLHTSNEKRKHRKLCGGLAGATRSPFTRGTGAHSFYAQRHARFAHKLNSGETVSRHVWTGSAMFLRRE